MTIALTVELPADQITRRHGRAVDAGVGPQCESPHAHLIDGKERKPSREAAATVSRSRHPRAI